MNLPSLVGAMSLRAKLATLNAAVAAALLLLAMLAWQSSSDQDVAQARQVRLAEALHLNKQADMVHDALRSDVLASLLIGQVPQLAQEDVLRHVADDAQELEDALDRLSTFTELPAELIEQVRRNRSAARAYGQSALELARQALDRREAALAALPAFDGQFRHLVGELEQQGAQIGEALREAQLMAAREATRARRSLVWTCVITIGVASAIVALMTLAIRRRLGELCSVAQAIADGDLTRRASTGRSDELGALGAAVDRMAGSLNTMIDDMRREARLAAFGQRLSDALDMADREHQVCTVAARAMGEVSAAHPMELLISDSSRAQMERVAEHPGAGSPGCGVRSPYDCVAVRRGTAVTFDSSADLHACEHLRGRACGTASAVCVPVTFMGRALGVLHAAGTPERPLSPAQAQQITVMGGQLGMRIGTVRAFERTQIQAATDTLTGLPNRRTLEQRLRALVASGQPHAVVMCDLDHFKLLNDRYGHATGDAALRVFSEVLRDTLGDGDLAGRWGGEEFTLLLAQADALAAQRTVDAIRHQLAAALRGGRVPLYTASFGIADASMSSRPEELVQLADMALYQAKAAGRDCARIADPATLAMLGKDARRRDDPTGDTGIDTSIDTVTAEAW
ncbi:diguanylate cyclase domain-containing protein [Sphaerotilus mobilis]|uniref:diguanylate cyclase n=1 Tax=Sphaerotilus mobilis TaxID=47994 RepID=A0A4Q7LEC8_9BURK|nr:diguanylate cyclase [Sphaerotilus mobilis]RZS52301.1 diguanylate cyclase (GGDEF)-like protein [Sphaerotilus mobilis]